jgi:hypothetical protein
MDAVRFGLPFGKGPFSSEVCIDSVSFIPEHKVLRPRVLGYVRNDNRG